jgi:predicted metal-dependent enzyme (double-stranded beta helix superfamily)
VATFQRTPDDSSELDANDPRLDVWFSQRSRKWEFSRLELEELVQALASRPHLWTHLVQHSVSERFYVRLHLDDTLEVWLICWSQQQDTGFHDHNGSRGAVVVTDGALEERRLAVASSTVPSVVYSSGTVFSFGPSHIHDVSQTGADLATSIHAYSPPLGEMGFYELTANGLLSRRSGDANEEFC